MQQPQRGVAPYLEAPLRPIPASRPLGSITKALLEDLEGGNYVMAQHQQTHCYNGGYPEPKCIGACSETTRMMTAN